ncbi:hypothetical protein AVEN_123041-1 [Araneus ventricosus]|uniref:Uncharacterized protein n=1 Tax=Araneus ventricosus TaxID=182803 RepID=A0A4Y2WPS7_ARAVE|nr:hypothetical protein AVEN_123041-1 [Araneus ventricosus]
MSLLPKSLASKLPGEKSPWDCTHVPPPDSAFYYLKIVRSQANTDHLHNRHSGLLPFAFIILNNWDHSLPGYRFSLPISSSRLIAPCYSLNRWLFVLMGTLQQLSVMI